MTIFTGLTKYLGRIRNRHLLMGDLILLPLAAVLAFALRLDASAIQHVTSAMLAYAIAAPLLKIPLFAALGLYSRYWQYADMDELMLLVWTAALGALTQGALFLGAQAFFPDLLAPGVPRSIPLIDVMVTLAAIGAPRLALRAGTVSGRRSRKLGLVNGHTQHVLIVGAGDAGAIVLRELRQNPQTGLVPVGFIDDDAAKHGVLLNRVRVLGGRAAIPAAVREHDIEQVIIAMPNASGQAIREIIDICDATGVRARTVPGIYELLGGTVKLSQLRDVRIDDLLRREPVHTDTARVEALLHGKRVLVTGAGGSIGGELCRQILRCRPASLILLGHGENSIFEIYNELKIENERLKIDATDLQSSIFNLQSQLVSVIADIRFPDRLETVFRTHRPEVVFHAAAHKHVPLMEDNVADAISNNIQGTLNVVEASIAGGVEHFVLISTDKAVNPSSIMGATKRVAELIVQAAAHSTGCAFVAVRFGNVLGSRGSVVPFFQKQIAAGGPVTVTHPEVRRYFMTIPEAVQLVLQAATMGRESDVFALDMGEPVRILDLARDLIRLSGLEPGVDIEIRFTGLRPGDKLYEEVFAPGEAYGRTEHEKILRYNNGSGPGGEAAGAGAAGAGDAGAEFAGRLQALIRASHNGDEGEMLRCLQRLVPEFAPPPAANGSA